MLINDFEVRPCTSIADRRNTGPANTRAAPDVQGLHVWAAIHEGLDRGDGEAGAVAESHVVHSRAGVGQRGHRIVGDPDAPTQIDNGKVVAAHETGARW